ncbi:50S ribosomal protein L3 glutamine methyltransferase [mine drainage metagenome]|uniref:50S ribosomal protein L3 glutamine methyltransferase n=1 Tax=mine drainage metagenome TaxID=410659 RepID=A0A1J5QY32_9ZZZZ
MTQELHTLRDWLRFAVSRFEQSGIVFGHGTQNSFDEAVWLILAALHLPRDTLNNFLDARLTTTERKHLAHLIERRITERIPTAYLVREAWLGDFRFYVDERVIVPRSFIAELLREQLAPWIEDPEEVVAVADICTGSGCLAILAAHAFPNADVDAIDISDEALAVAGRNIDDYGLIDHVHPIRSDMLSGCQGKRYDLIISNPPYVDAPSMEALPQEYRQEPGLALASGADGLDHTHTLLRDAAEHLHPGGLLVVEIGHNRDKLEAAYPELPFTWLEVSAGDQFVFLLGREQLLA